MNKSGAIAVPGSLVLTNKATARLMQSWQLYSPYRSPSLTVTLYPNSLLDLAGFEEWIGPLITEGGEIITGDSGQLFQTGDITVVTNQVVWSSIYGNLQLYSYPAASNSATIFCAGHFNLPDLVINANVSSSGITNLILNGNGYIELANGSNTFTAAVTVNGGQLWVDYSNSLGNTNAPATVNSGGCLFLQNIAAVGLKPLVLNGNGSPVSALTAYGTNSWAGDITLASDSAVSAASNSVTYANLTLGGTIGGPGGLTKSGPGIVILSGSTSNNFAGTTFVQQGILELTKTNAVAVPGPLVVGTGTGPANSVLVELFQPGQLNPNAPVTLNSDGLLDLVPTTSSSAGSISGSGEINLGFAQLSVGFDNTSTTFSGPIVGLGSAAVVKAGTGAWTVTGISSFFGQTEVGAGTLFVDGYLGNGPTIVSNSATLSGNGTVGNLTALAGSTISPGQGPGVLSSGSVSFSPGSTYLLNISGTNAAYNQLNVTGTVTENSPNLQVIMSTPGGTNYHYVFINNDLTDPVTGTFASLPEGSTVVANNGRTSPSAIKVIRATTSC